MILVLTNGKKFMPRGSIKMEEYGVRISGMSNTITIPYPQIAWIYEGQDFKDEEKVFNQLPVSRRRFRLGGTFQELMGDLYGV